MNVAEADIQRIVREVLDQLVGSTSAGDVAPAQSTPPDVLLLDDAVVSLESLRGCSTGMRGVSVLTTAVVTPAARDRLRELNLPLQRRAARWPQAGTKSEITLAATHNNALAAALAGWLTAAGCPVARLANTGLATLVSELALDVARGGRRAILVTDETYAAVCLANRQRGVRAAWIDDAQQLEAARRQIGVNLLVVDARRAPTPAVRRLVEAFATAGDAPSPSYAQALG